MTAPTTRGTSHEEVLEHVASEVQVWVRVAAVPDGKGSWVVRLGEVASGEAPPSWEKRDWVYPEVLFSGYATDGPSVAAWLRAEQLEVCGHLVPVPQMSTGTVTWERRQSGSPAGYERVRVTTSAVEIELVGSALHGMAVELPGEAPGPRHEIVLRPDHEGTYRVRFELDEGLPPGTWVLLREGPE